MKNGKNIVNDAIIKDISDSIHGLKYGTVMITVHDSRIVQIEVTEKNRFDDIWHKEGGGI
ncbi:MAG: DUF2292 domain-containing protein [Candidatus Omnitrophica bacterium]|nr:DUF2292 domain-containing protein [Candidatus Omnitrophota bacterium]MDD5236307.1 DUF2292 domain-containing protein [Candidatus Omnitrophota bacterium]MDD5610310.1 DUF2292 domain-containing protein [Candidatus Omnitrophota bacterium]